MLLGKWAGTGAHMQDKIIQNLQAFVLPGLECYYQVFILPLMGPSLFSLYPDKMPMAIRMSAAKQLLKRLESLHIAGIVHRGKPIRKSFISLFHIILEINSYLQT